jgi:hypothetical protein
MAKSGSVKDQSWGKLTGNEHMLGWRGTGKQEPGQVAQMGTGAKRGIEPKAGGQVAFVSDNAKRGREMSLKHGSNTDYAGTQEAGTSGPTKKGGNSKFAEGGSTHMFGNRGSKRAEPGQSGCC